MNETRLARNPFADINDLENYLKCCERKCYRRMNDWSHSRTIFMSNLPSLDIPIGIPNHHLATGHHPPAYYSPYHHSSGNAQYYYPPTQSPDMGPYYYSTTFSYPNSQYPYVYSHPGSYYNMVSPYGSPHHMNEQVNYYGNPHTPYMYSQLNSTRGMSSSTNTVAQRAHPAMNSNNQKWALLKNEYTFIWDLSLACTVPHPIKVSSQLCTRLRAAVQVRWVDSRSSWAYFPNEASLSISEIQSLHAFESYECEQWFSIQPMNVLHPCLSFPI